MKVVVDESSLKPTLDRAYVLFYGFAVFALLGFLGEVFLGNLGMRSLIWGFALWVSYRFFRETLSHFQYSFWSFAAGFAIYILITISKGGEGAFFIVNCYLIALIFLIVLCWTLSSPIFFPRITWWEYDFRFCGELKITVLVDGVETSGRLTDLRQGAGCIMLFEKLEPEKEITIRYNNDSGINMYKAKIMSRRSTTLGRAYTYGVKFCLLDEKDKKKIKYLSDIWKVEKKAKRVAKFETVNLEQKDS